MKRGSYVPKPIVHDVRCSVCGFAWDDHEKNPMEGTRNYSMEDESAPIEECVRLLKAELAKIRGHQ